MYCFDRNKTRVADFERYTRRSEGTPRAFRQLYFTHQSSLTGSKNTRPKLISQPL
jgi:hypothetical protein